LLFASVAGCRPQDLNNKGMFSHYRQPKLVLQNVTQLYAQAPES
jgi:hypothetical protein